MKLSPKIIYEDNDLLVIDKPAGVVVNRAETVKEETIQDWAENKLRIKSPFFKLRASEKLKIKNNSDFYNRGGIVHRLDKETSGLLIIAKNKAAFWELQRQFKDREVEKKYLTLVHGEVKPTEGKIEALIKRNPFNRKKFGVFLGGREAVTEYKIRRYYLPIKILPCRQAGLVDVFNTKIQKRKEKLTLVEVFPRTGRTHQIRVHFKYLGHPVVSDENYAGRKTARDDRKFCPRLFLHAFYLKFKQPMTKKELIFELELPEDLQTVLNNS